MYPYIELSGHEISSYSLMAVIGCAVSFSVILMRCPKKGLRIDDQLYFIAFILFSVSRWISLIIILPPGFYMVLRKTESNVLVWNWLNGRKSS